MFQEKPPGALVHEISLDRRDPLELGRQSVECPRAIGRSLGDILYNAPQYPQKQQRGSKLTERIFVYNFLEFIVAHLCEVVTVDVLLELFVGPTVEE